MSSNNLFRYSFLVVVALVVAIAKNYPTEIVGIDIIIRKQHIITTERAELHRIRIYAVDDTNIRTVTTFD